MSRISRKAWQQMAPHLAHYYPDATPMPGATPMAQGGRWTVVMDGWTPPTVNALMRGHWATRARIKKAAVNRVVAAMRAAGVPAATGKRRVTIAVEYGNRGHLSDPDNVPKAVLDGLKRAAVLIDDTAEWCDCPTATVARGDGKRTTLVIEDIETDAKEQAS